MSETMYFSILIIIVSLVIIAFNIKVIFIDNRRARKDLEQRKAAFVRYLDRIIDGEEQA